MSEPIRRPQFVAGTPRKSGDLQTGEILVNRGGMETFTNFSGTAAGNDVAITSGAGRLHDVLQHVQMISGQSVLIYDGAVATSGGPFSASGHKVLAVIPSTYRGGAVSGVAATEWDARPIVIDRPFYSGLIAATRSGTPGFSVSFTRQLSGTGGAL